MNTRTIPSTVPGAPRISWRRWAPPAAIALVTVVAFLPALDNGWVDWDDEVAFLTNPHYRGLGLEHLRWMWTTFDVAIYRPLTWMTLGADFLVWGMNPAGYHLTSLAIHTLNAVLVYAFAARLLALAVPRAASSGWLLASGAAFAALVFALHPMRVEPTAWVSGRADLLSATCALLTLLAYLRHCGSRTTSVASAWLWIALVFYLLSLLAKPLTLTLPLVLVALDVYPLRRLALSSDPRRLPARGVWLEKALFLLVALAIAPVIVMAKAPSIPEVVGSKALFGIAVTAYSLAFHLWKTVVPTGLSPLYERPFLLVATAWPYVVSAAVVLAVTALAVRVRRRWPAGLTAWFCYIVVLAPMWGLVPYGAQIAADRYTYLATLGLSMLAGGGLLATLHASNTGRVDRRIALAASGLAVAVVTVLGLLSWRQTHIWRDGFALWSHTVKVRPETSAAHYNLGNLLLREGRYEEAREALARGARLDPGNIGGMVTLATTLFALGQQDAARDTLRGLLVRAPDAADVYQQLGSSLLAQERLGEAAEFYRAALEQAPDNAEVHNGLGVILARTGNLGESEQRFRRAIELEAKYAAAHNNLANALVGAGRLEEAVEHYTAAIASDPGSTEARVNLADALATSQRFDAAAGWYREAIAIEPDHLRAHHNLGVALMKLGQPAAAARHFERALTINPAAPGTRQKLQEALAASRGER